jgi:hypothetical protein
MHWSVGVAEPVFIPKAEFEALDSLAKARNVSRDEAVHRLVHQGIKDDF